jgi:hypothetical protein
MLILYKVVLVLLQLEKFRLGGGEGFECLGAHARCHVLKVTHSSCIVSAWGHASSG